MKYADVRILLLLEYAVPMILTITLIFLCERRSKVAPVRDAKEFNARVISAFMAIILFMLQQLFIRFKE